MKQINIKIGTFGDRAVGKTTYLTTLHGALSNHLYEDMEVRYHDDKTTQYLKENFNDLVKTKIVKNTVGTKDISFDLWYSKNKEDYRFKVEMRDLEGEKTKVENMQIQELVSFLASCDAIIYFYSITDKSDNPEEQNPFDLNTILTRITHLESSRKTKKTFVLIITKFDEMIRPSDLAMLNKYKKDSEEQKQAGKAILKSWVEENCSLLISELGRFVENFKVIVTSSYLALDVIKENNLVSPHKEGNTNIETPGVDVAYPLTYILNQHIEEVSKRDVVTKIWKYFSIVLLSIGFFFF